MATADDAGPTLSNQHDGRRHCQRALWRYPHRAWPYLGEAQAYWENPSPAADLQAAIGRIRDHLARAGIDRHYANYPDLAFQDWPAAYYRRENYKRLQGL